MSNKIKLPGKGSKQGSKNTERRSRPRAYFKKTEVSLFKDKMKASLEEV